MRADNPRKIMSQLLAEAKRRRISILQLTHDCKLGRNSLYFWKRRQTNDALLSTVMQVADQLGYELQLVKKGASNATKAV
jgi:DNA-binding phage protein